MRSGDMKAFERLFVSLYPGLCNIANHYLNNEMLSKDVAQDAFIKWWNKREDFRDFAAVKSFLYITIRNQCLNYIRDHRKEVDLAGRFSEETDADFDLMVIEEEAIEALYSAIDRLPAQSARIMRLVVKGDKNQEIADQLGISVNSVKTLKYNALNILRKELEWIRRGAKARTTKQKGRIQRYEKLKDQDAPQTDGSVEISSISSRMGKTTVELSHISKSYDSRVLIRDFTYIFLKNDRIGFVGANGSGKTTLMKIIDQRIQPDEGTVTIGQTIKIGYYTQEIENTKDAGIAYMDPNEKVIDYIKNTAEFVRTKDGLVSASNMLERFLFPSSQQYSPIGKLSGGEKRRLNLLRVLMEAPNVLILDEPTNDLDIRTLTILEDYLDNYEGIVITVSHDRYFLDRVVNRIFAFEEDGKICQYEGGYTDYVNRLAEEGKVPAGHILDAKNDTTTSVDSVEKENQTSSMDTWKRERKLKFSYKEQKEYETIEDDIAALEQKIEELDAQTLKFSSDFVKLNEITKEKEQTEQLLEEKMERWEYLEDLAAKIAGQQ